MDLGQLRRDFESAGLGREALADDPIGQFERWFLEAENSGIEDVNAMVLATADSQGYPGARTVLLKSFDRQGFVFYTNYTSRKARDMDQNPRATLLMPWLALNRQVVVEGRVERVSSEDSLRYFASRPRGSQLSAWVSHQSATADSRDALEARLAEVERQYAGRDVPRPEFWGGYRVCPERMEFWQGRPDRLHDRFEYRRAGESWQIRRLQP